MSFVLRYRRSRQDRFSGNRFRGAVHELDRILSVSGLLNSIVCITGLPEFYERVRKTPSELDSR